MENLSDRLASRLKQQHVLVFPTELAARSWTEHLLLDPERFGLSVVREDRLISWDTCRQQLFPRRNRGLQTADRMYRILFVQHVLERNRKEVFFRLLVPPEHAENSAVFVSSLVRVCPYLPDMLEALKSASGRGALADLRHDIEQMLTDYTRFLEAGGLYEPAFEHPKLDQESLTAGRRHYVLCFPEVMQGFERLADQLEASSHIELLRAEETAIPSLEVYENQVVEFKAAFQQLEGLLQGGAVLEDIAVTLCDYDHMIEDIAYQGRLRGIPLRFTSGRRLSSYPAARLFGDIQRLVQDDFSLQSMKRLLLSRSYPWKYPVRNRELITFGIEASCLRNWRDGKGLEHDVWKDRLQKSGQKELLGYYTLVKESLTALVKAKDVQRLWNQFHSLWQSLFLSWEDSGNQKASGVFPFCVEQLSRLRQAIEQTGDPDGPGPYQLWLTVLENTWYVPQQEPGGIAVYPYGISAGINPKHHILLGADKSHTSVSEDPYILLSQQQRDELSLTGRDMTDAMLKVYAASGEHLYASCSRVTREGEQLPPSVFLEEKKTVEVPSDRLWKDPYHQEIQLWRGEHSSIISLYPRQKASYERALVSILSEGGLDATQKLPRGDSPVLELSSRRLTGDSGPVQLSPTSLDSYLACPFSWFLMKVLNLPQQEFEPDMGAARWVGELIHTCYERFFSWLIDEEDGVFEAERIHEYQEVLTRIIEKTLSGSRRRWNSPAAVVWCQITRLLTEQLPQLFSCEVAELNGAKSIETECELAWKDPSGAFKLVGRIDRVALLSSGDGVALIDYKKKSRVKKKSFSAASNRPDSYQLPMYTFLWERGQEHSKPVSKALYFDVTEGKYVRVFPYQFQKVTVDREQFDRVIEQMVKDTQEIAQRISLLDVRLASEESKTCQYCSFRDVCRGRFAVR